MILDLLGLFLLLAGFVVGLGAVTVIDFHGLLARRSAYWTEATIRSHKITKPLIWLGIFLATAGGAVFYRHRAFDGLPLYHAWLALVLALNGAYLSFRVSPFLLEREKRGQAAELLPASMQTRIFASFLVSFFGWWGALLLLAAHLAGLRL